MNKEDVLANLNIACNLLYMNMSDLIHTKTHERTIVSKLANYLEPLFIGWDIHVEYNREGSGSKSKRSLEDELIIPDIIIHNRGNIEGPNLAAIQVKGYWNPEDRTEDESKLRKLRMKYKYENLYRIELDFSSFKLVEVN